jgi:hypothetical protein
VSCEVRIHRAVPQKTRRTRNPNPVVFLVGSDPSCSTDWLLVARQSS